MTGPAPRTGRDRTRRVRLLTAIVVGLVAVAGLLAATVFASAPSEAEIERGVFSALRCPVCAGESIADSTAPVAVAMREEASRQLASGHEPDDVVAWFAQAYGAGILLDPPPQGSGLLIRAMPVVAVAIAAVAVLLFLRHGRRRGMTAAVVGAAGILAVAMVVDLAPDGGSGPASEDAGGREAVVARAVLESSVSERPGDAGARVAYALVLAEHGEARAAADQLGAAVRLRPADADVAFLYATLLGESGDDDAAGEALDHVLEARPDHAPALLARGTMLLRAGDERGGELLEEFLRLAPDDPAADDVRGMWEGDDAAG